jgi:hypothetical protein
MVVGVDDLYRLLVPGGIGPPFLDFPVSNSRASALDHRAELPLDRAHPGGSNAVMARPREGHQEPLVAAASEQ